MGGLPSTVLQEPSRATGRAGSSRTATCPVPCCLRSRPAVRETWTAWSPRTDAARGRCARPPRAARAAFLFPLYFVSMATRHPAEKCVWLHFAVPATPGPRPTARTPCGGRCGVGAGSPGCKRGALRGRGRDPRAAQTPPLPRHPAWGKHLQLHVLPETLPPPLSF